MLWPILGIIILLFLPGLWSSYWLLGLALLLSLVIVVLNRLWLWRSTQTTRLSRVMQNQAFRGDTIEVELIVHNGGRLPLPWVQVRDAVPGGLASVPKTEWLLSVRGQEKVRLHYKLECRKRGRYKVGPMEGYAGVLFDTGGDPGGRRLTWADRARLVVYPQVVPLEQLALPSRLSLGNLRTRQPLLPDPSRIAGVREYQSGDDPRYIDWRNTAHLNQLMVKQFERTRIVPLAIFLDMRPPDKKFLWTQLAETSIVVAASLAFRANDLKQPFGLYSNGYDPGWEESQWNESLPPEFGRPEMAPRSGTPWLYEVLDKLAGLLTRTDTPGLEQLAGKWSSNLPWGATVAVIGYEPYPALVTEIGRLRKAGFTPVAIFVAAEHHTPEAPAALAALRTMGIQVYDISYPGELNLAKV